MAKAKGVPRYYVDSCVFLSFVEGTKGRTPAIHAIFSECEKGECELFTSELSVAEVAFGKAEKDGKSLDAATENAIDNLWDPAFPLQMVEVHQLVVQEAKGLIRKAMDAGWVQKEEWSLKASDAIHLATGKRHNVDAFLTYDRKLRKFSRIMGYDIREPVPPSQLLFDDPEPSWTPRVPPHWRTLICSVSRNKQPFVPHLRRRR